MGQPHRWAKEIHAWADGADIEQLAVQGVNDSDDWHEFDGVWDSDDDEYVYRIKPQPKEPQYLYVYEDKNGFLVLDTNKYSGCIGKIKLETDDD